MLNGSATLVVGSARLGSARLGSARQEHSTVFSACQVLFHTIYNEPVAGAGRIMPWLRFFAFTGKAVV